VRLTRLKGQAQRQAFTNQVLLTNDFTQVAWAQSLCQGLLQMNADAHGRITWAPAGVLNRNVSLGNLGLTSKF
jgi:hypothetical protein